MLHEAKRLYLMGFAIHWLKPNSKAPVKSNWTAPTRDDPKTLVREYRDDYGIGVKLGQASKLVCGGFLANIDIDIKSSDQKHRNEALAFFEEKFPGLLDKAPTVRTGYGLRVFVRTKEPMQSGKLTASREQVKVKMPSSPVSKNQINLLTTEELKEGWRMRPAWEIEFMSTGRQVVLPPSIHPDTRQQYTWDRPINSPKEIPYVKFDELSEVAGKKRGRPAGTTVVQSFKPQEVELVGRLPLSIIDMIAWGGEVEDRSAACQTVANHMVRAQFTDDEILSVLTDQNYHLGEVGYDHRRTTSRASAAAWIRDFVLAPARRFVDPTVIFGDVEITPNIELSDEDADKQFKEVVYKTPWQDQLKRTGKKGDGPPKANFENTVLILGNVCGPLLFRHDEFSGREFYAKDAPWVGGKSGKAISDSDYINIKAWLCRRFGYEPSVNIIYEACAHLAAKNSFHPIKELFDAMPAWDGVERLDSWLKENFNAQGPEAYLSQIFRKWMVASVMRIYEPGAKFDWMPILEGAQGTGKSSFGAILFGQQYFADWLPNLADKDAAAGLQGLRCVEFGELDSLRRNEVETVKAFVTRQVDKFRPAYGRKTIECPRQVVFFGTTNKDQYLKDETGNRRFLPVKVGKLNFKRLLKEREQLWAEALWIYQHGMEDSLYLDPEAEEYAKKMHREKTVADESHLMAEALADFIEAELPKPANEQFPFHRFRLTQLFDSVAGPLRKWRCDHWTCRHAAKAMRLVDQNNSVPFIRSKFNKGTLYWEISIDNWAPEKEIQK